MQEKNKKTLYKLVKILGQGSYSKVYMAMNRKTRSRVAIKILKIGKMDRINIQSAVNEILILSQMDSEFVVRYYDSFFLPRTNQLWIVMELMEGGDLYHLIKQLVRQQKFLNEKKI